MDHARRTDATGLKHPQRLTAALGIAVFSLGIFASTTPVMAKPKTTAKSTRHKPLSSKQTKGSGHPKTSQPSSITPSNADYIKSLTPVASGPGVVVTEPVVQGGDDDAAAFGTGCSRWLQFALAGTKSLGKTPMLGQINRVRREMAKPDLRFSTEEAEQAGKLLGVTHVAVGSLTGTPGQHTLTYHLWSVQTNAAVGEEISLTGSDDQIVAALPSAGQKLCSQLGVDTTQIPTSVGATAAEISQVGRATWVTSAPFSIVSPEPLLNLSRRFPVAGVWLLGSALLQDDEQEQALAKTLLTLAPDNPLVYGEIANHAQEMFPSYQNNLEHELKLSPNNYLLAQSNTWLQEKLGDETAACQAAEQAVRCFPDSPDAWLTLASPIGEAANTLRRGRSANQVPEADWTALNAAYARWEAAAAKATALDPTFGKAWLRLAKAATFAGDTATADSAFWKAVQLDQEELGDVYFWGIQMYQPKWNDDEKKLLKVVRLAAQAQYKDIGEIISLSAEMKQLGLDDLADAMLTQITADRQAASQSDPKDPQAHYDLALALQAQNRPAEAAVEVQSFIAINPHIGEAHFLLGQLWNRQNKPDMAITEFREAIRLRPAEAKWHEQLGNALHTTNQTAEAEKEFREAVALDTASSTAHRSLGEILGPDKAAEAITELQEAARLDPMSTVIMFDLRARYDQTGQYTKSIALCNQLISLEVSHDPNDTLYRLWAAEDYNKQGDHTQASATYHAALLLHPKSYTLHQGLGDTFLALNQLKEARAEWEQVVALAGTNSGGYLELAEKELAEHPLPAPKK